MMKRQRNEAKKHLQEAHKIAARIHSPFAGLTMEQAIQKMRKVREELWEEKFAVHP